MTKAHVEQISLTATKGFMPLIRKVVPYLLTCTFLGGSGVVASDMSDLNSRVTKIEQTVSDNSVEINGTVIRLNNYDARLVDMKDDLRITRESTERILIILTKRER